VLSKIRPDADPAEYEKWVMEYDYPTSKKLKSIIHYRTYKVKGALEGSPEYSYIEHIDITDIEEYKKDLSTSIAEELLKQWSSFIEEAEMLITEMIE